MRSCDPAERSALDLEVTRVQGYLGAPLLDLREREPPQRGPRTRRAAGGRPRRARRSTSQAGALSGRDQLRLSGARDLRDPDALILRAGGAHAHASQGDLSRGELLRLLRTGERDLLERRGCAALRLRAEAAPGGALRVSELDRGQQGGTGPVSRGLRYAGRAPDSDRDRRSRHGDATDPRGRAGDLDPDPLELGLGAARRRAAQAGHDARRGQSRAPGRPELRDRSQDRLLPLPALGPPALDLHPRGGPAPGPRGLPRGDPPPPTRRPKSCRCTSWWTCCGASS